MLCQFSTPDGDDWRPAKPIPHRIWGGSVVEGVWAGSAYYEKLDWWLNEPEIQIAVSPEISGIGVIGDTDRKTRWSLVPKGACLFFLIGPPQVGKYGNIYRLSKLVTIPATPSQAAFFQDDRFALLGRMREDGGVSIITRSIPHPHFFQ